MIECCEIIFLIILPSLFCSKAVCDVTRLVIIDMNKLINITHKMINRVMAPNALWIKKIVIRKISMKGRSRIMIIAFAENVFSISCNIRSILWYFACLYSSPNMVFDDCNLCKTCCLIVWFSLSSPLAMRWRKLRNKNSKIIAIMTPVIWGFSVENYLKAISKLAY